MDRAKKLNCKKNISPYAKVLGVVEQVDPNAGDSRQWEPKNQYLFTELGNRTQECRRSETELNKGSDNTKLIKYKLN